VEALRDVALRAPADTRSGLLLIADSLAQALAQYESVVSYMLEQTPENIRAAYMGSVPYLMLTGYVLGGWQMARAALACVGDQTVFLKLGLSPEFMSNKFATAVFYAGVVLPRTEALGRSIHQGVALTQVLERSTLM
jgi:hypothetical protein